MLNFLMVQIIGERWSFWPEPKGPLLTWKFLQRKKDKDYPSSLSMEDKSVPVAQSGERWTGLDRIDPVAAARALATSALAMSSAGMARVR